MAKSLATIAPAFRALVDGFVDYAGVFPPASLTRDIAMENYQKYARSEYSWMLRWLVIGAAELEHVPSDFDGKLAVLTEADEQRAAVIETKSVVSASRPAYCEVSLDQLDKLASTGAYAKIRTGGLKPEAIPSVEEVAKFILACADGRVAFKATAGLHHAIRAEYALTYEADAPRAVMHGFINVLMAAAFAWNGERDIVPILSETDPASFRFDELAHWRDKSINAEQVRNARRNFVHSVGSCSFEEPVQDLVALGLI